jgi:hypothetical protein
MFDAEPHPAAPAKEEPQATVIILQGTGQGPLPTAVRVLQGAARAAGPRRQRRWGGWLGRVRVS